MTERRPGADELYVGYLPQAPSGVAAWMRRTVVALFVAVVAVALAVVAAQGELAPAVYEYQVFRDFTGVVRAAPYPVLEVERPGAAGAPARFSRYYLVAPGKHGAGELVAGLDGRRVRLRGALLYRDDQTMIEVVPGSVLAEGGDAAAAREAAGEAAGTMTLRGRIVDSKCFLGIMKPGSTKPHRACAARCISGGAPPLFIVSDAHGPAAYLLLVGADGRAVNAEVLPVVDEPLEITGEVARVDDLWVLRAEPATWRRLP